MVTEMELDRRDLCFNLGAVLKMESREICL